MKEVSARTKFAGPLAQGVLDLVFAFLAVVIGFLRARRGRRLGGVRGGNSRAKVAPSTRRSGSAPKNDLKKRIKKCNAFGPQNVAKSIPKSLQKLTQNP